MNAVLFILLWAALWVGSGFAATRLVKGGSRAMLWLVAGVTSGIVIYGGVLLMLSLSRMR